MDDYKKSFDEIKAEIAQAKKLIRLGGTYDHYKGQGRYIVIMFATQEADNELCVVYQRINTDLHFTRPVKEWVEEVEWEGQTVPRFKLVA
jgi:hypothetical protein